MTPVRILALAALGGCAQPKAQDSSAPVEECGVPPEELPAITQVFDGLAAFGEGGDISGDAWMAVDLRISGSAASATLDLYPRPALTVNGRDVPEEGVEVSVTGTLCASTAICDVALGCTRGELGNVYAPSISAIFEVWKGGETLTVWLEGDEQDERAQLSREEPYDAYFIPAAE